MGAKGGVEGGADAQDREARFGLEPDYGTAGPPVGKRKQRGADDVVQQLRLACAGIGGAELDGWWLGLAGAEWYGRGGRRTPLKVSVLVQRGRVGEDIEEAI